MAKTADNCLQLKTGSCAGCDNIALANQRAQRGENPAAAAQSVESNLCPDNIRMQQHLVRRQVTPVW